MTRPLVVAGSRMHHQVVAELGSFARTLVNRDETPWPPGELRRRAAAADALIAFMPDRIDSAFLDGCPRLRLIAGALKGADNIDRQACAARGVRVTVVEDLLSAPTAELALVLTLGLLRHLRLGDTEVRQGHDGWRPRLYGSSLVDAEIGVLGMGGVGRALVELLAGFRTHITYHDPIRLNPRLEERLRLRWCPADDLPARSGSALILLCPLDAKTLGWLNSQRLAQLPMGTVVVNVGRGSVVDEDAVLAALEKGHLAGYAADVFAFEDLARVDRPSRVNERLLAHPRTLFTPHLGSAVAAVRMAIERQAVAAVRTFYGLDRLRESGSVPLLEAMMGDA